MVIPGNSYYQTSPWSSPVTRACAWLKNRECLATTTATATRTSSQNVNSPNCDPFATIPGFLMWQRLVVPQEENRCKRRLIKGRRWKFIKSWRSPLNLKFGYFTLLFCWRRQRNLRKWKTHMQSFQSYSFYSPNMQICDVAIARRCRCQSSLITRENERGRCLFVF